MHKNRKRGMRTMSKLFMYGTSLEGIEQLMLMVCISMLPNTVKRPYAEEQAVTVEQWEFVVGYKVESAKVVPGSTKYLERYTVVPNATFGK